MFNPQGLRHLDLTPGTEGWATGAPDLPGLPAAVTSNVVGALTSLGHWVVPQRTSYYLVRPHLVDDVVWGAGALRPRFKFFSAAAVELDRLSLIAISTMGPVDQQPQRRGQQSYENYALLTAVAQFDRNNARMLAFDFDAGVAADVLELVAGSKLIVEVRGNLSVSFGAGHGTVLAIPILRGTAPVGS